MKTRADMRALLLLWLLTDVASPRKNRIAVNRALGLPERASRLRWLPALRAAERTDQQIGLAYEECRDELDGPVR